MPCWRRVIGPVVLFEVALGLATLGLLDPLRVVLIDRLIALGGDPFVGNTALIGFVLSPLGAGTLALAAIIATLLLAVEFGGLGLILRDGLRGRPVRVRRVAARLVARLPALLVLSALAVGLLILLAVPVAAVGLAAKAAWLSDADIYFYVTTRPAAFVAVIAVVAVAALIVGFVALRLLVRYGLAVPICLIEGVAAPTGLRRAAVVVRGRERTLALRLLAVAVAGLVVTGLAAAGLSGLYGLVSGPDQSLPAALRVTVAFALLAAVVFALLGMLFRVALATVLMHAYAETGAVPAREHAPAARASLGLRGALAAVAVIAIAAVVQAWLIAGAVAPDRAITVTAHRAGTREAPENTLAALDRAVAAGADVVEIDVQETRDGAVVVLHDTDLRRVAGLPASIWALDLADVQALDAGSWFAPAFAGERIPTLAEFAAAARGRVRLNVELKVNGRGVDLAGRTLAILREAGMTDAAVISSLDGPILAEVRALAPELPVGLIVATGVGDLGAADVSFVSLAQRRATPARIRALNHRGRAVHVWTLNTDEQIAGALLDGADAIITDNPARARAIVRWYEDLTTAERVLLRLRRASRIGVSGAS